MSVGGTNGVFDTTLASRNSSPQLVAERDGAPPGPAPPADRLVPVPVAFAELAVRQQAKRAGGTWNPDRKVWQLRYDRAIVFGLEERIVPDAGSERGPSISRASPEHLMIDAATGRSQHPPPPAPAHSAARSAWQW